MGGRIAIFGGSFNPVHSGHVRVAENAIDRLKLDKIIVVPAACNPFKTGGERFLSPSDRLELVHLAFGGNPKVVIDDRELEKGGVSFAIDTVREIAAEESPEKLYFLVGEDSVPGLPRWKDYGELVKLCEFASFPRTVESSTEIRNLARSGGDFARFMPEKAAKRLKEMDFSQKKGTGNGKEGNST